MDPTDWFRFYADEALRRGQFSLAESLYSKAMERCIGDLPCLVGRIASCLSIIAASSSRVEVLQDTEFLRELASTWVPARVQIALACALSEGLDSAQVELREAEAVLSIGRQEHIEEYPRMLLWAREALAELHGALTHSSAAMSTSAPASPSRRQAPLAPSALVSLPQLLPPSTASLPDDVAHRNSSSLSSSPSTSGTAVSPTAAASPVSPQAMLQLARESVARCAVRVTLALADPLAMRAALRCKAPAGVPRSDPLVQAAMRLRPSHARTNSSKGSSSSGGSAATTVTPATAVRSSETVGFDSSQYPLEVRGLALAAERDASPMRTILGMHSSEGGSGDSSMTRLEAAPTSGGVVGGLLKTDRPEPLSASSLLTAATTMMTDSSSDELTSSTMAVSAAAMSGACALVPRDDDAEEKHGDEEHSDCAAGGSGGSDGAEDGDERECFADLEYWLIWASQRPPAATPSAPSSSPARPPEIPAATRARQRPTSSEDRAATRSADEWASWPQSSDDAWTEAQSAASAAAVAAVFGPSAATSTSALTTPRSSVVDEAESGERWQSTLETLETAITPLARRRATRTRSDFPALEMVEYGGGYRGVEASRDIADGEEVMAIDARCIITVEMGRETEIGRRMSMAYPPLDLSAAKHCYTAVFLLLCLEHPGSFFAPYLRILPKSFSGVPLYWTEEELSWLSGSFMLQQIADRRANIASDYEEICRASPDFRRFSLGQFLWARIVVASRNFGVTMDGRKTDALVPYADMLNHYRPRETRWTFNETRGVFTIHAVRDIARGSQVFDSYGKKCNSRFLLNYGFTVEYNRDDDGVMSHNELRVVLRMPSSAEDPYWSRKRALLDGAEATRAVRIGPSVAHPVTREALSFLRFAIAQGRDVDRLCYVGRDSYLGKRHTGPLSIANEVAALRTLAGICEDVLDEYPTTLEEDLRELSAGMCARGSNRRNALVLVRGEKEIGRFFLRLAQVAVPLLYSSPAELNSTLRKPVTESREIDRYIRAVVKPLVTARQFEFAGAASY